jgi:diacylglycerol O-acyltransferase-1
MKDHDLIFYKHDSSNNKPIATINVVGLLYHLDAKTKTLLLSDKKNNAPVVKIASSPVTLGKIEKFCQDNNIHDKHEPKRRSPLWYTPNNKVSESYLADPKIHQNYGGFVNLAFMIIFIVKLKDLIAMYRANGLIAPPPTALPSALEIGYGFLCVLGTSLLMFGIEKLAFKKILPNGLAMFLQVLNLASLLLLTILFCHYFEPNPLFGLAHMFWCLMMLLKMISYVHIMNEVRNTLPQALEKNGKSNGNHKTRKEDEEIVSRENIEVIKKYQKNISEIVNAKDILYFYFAPTLSYQLWYPRSSHISWSKIGNLLIKLVLVLVVFMTLLTQQFLPILEPSCKILIEGAMIEKLEAILNFSSCFAMLFIMFFYTIFELYCNILAEILRFANRDFYRDWWNSHSMADFWRLWNLPVHRWMIRHLYNPLMNKGLSKNVAVFVVFLISGIAHELLVCLPLRVYSSTFLVFMLIQIPAVALEKMYDLRFKRIQVDNILFWCFSWLVLVPFGMLYYYGLFLNKHGWSS